MARESKRKRDEKRFGKAERLVDSIAQEFGNLPVDETNPPFPRRRLFADFLSGAVPIEASNVSSYYSDLSRRNGGFDLVQGLPCLAPPFDLFFVEMFQPQIGNGTSGWLFFDASSTEHRELIRSKTFFRTADFERGVSAKWWLWASSVYRLPTPGGIFGPFADALIFVDEDGRLSLPPTIHFNGNTDGDMETIRNIIENSLAPACLTLCFMNCKNVAIEPVDPPREVNRERKKHGLRPFVRYHTINIEPMKKVLRTEGRVETEGLKKALHICRGHFSHYSEEKPLFGKHAGTFWVPAHVRGTAKQGVVVSDYNVKPGSPVPQTHPEGS